MFTTKKIFFGQSMLVHRVVVLAAAILGIGLVHGQEIGKDLCDCSPGTYNLVFDFSEFVCPGQGFDIPGALASDPACFVSPFGDPSVTDLVPVLVEQVDILELDQNLVPISQENVKRTFVEGDVLTYRNFATVSPDSIQAPENVVGGIQFNILGENRGGGKITSTVLIPFSNACSVHPVLSAETDKIGWVRFGSLDPASNQFCPLAEAPPTSPPTMAPSIMDKPTPTSAPMPTSFSMSMSMFTRQLNMDAFLLDGMDEFEKELQAADVQSEFGTVRKTQSAVTTQEQSHRRRLRERGSIQRKRKA